MMELDIANLTGRSPLVEYPWRSEVDRLLFWLQDKEPTTKAFCFDVVMSAAYIDATSGVERSIEECENIESDFNSHIGFINLCSPCYTEKSIWSYQKAVKPQSGALGKLSSEVILRFIELLSPQLKNVVAIGGSEVADAVLNHLNGVSILAEVKSAPLLTYPFLFNVPDSCLKGAHEKIIITNSQLRNCESGMFFHNVGTIALGKVGTDLWPFKPLVDFFINEANQEFLHKCVDEWISARRAYTSKDRNNKMYYLANACGSPPKIAKERDGWPKNESISDGKTSAGMDRTDDIKKGIYQSIKIGTSIKDDSNIKTAIVSNLPAYRHGNDYVSPFTNMLWGVDNDIVETTEGNVIFEKDLRRVFDFIITLEQPILRNITL
ncbi:hypothetical protein QNF11_003694 [Vibrio vulnificus]|nr:hypothetical protein [Vibrio vulnificus]